MNVVKMEICSCPAVVDISIVRPDLKYQLGFSIHEGMVSQLSYSGKFSKGNIFMVFNNQIYSWKKICGLQLGAVSIKP